MVVWVGEDVGSAIDGRHARRARSRIAVIDAVFALVRDGKVPLTAEDLAERAGVSVSSVFRNFDGLDDMQRQAFDVFRERYSHLLDPAVASDAPRRQRVAQHVKSRLALLDAAGPMMQIARHRAIDYQPMAEGVGRSRWQLSDQTRAHFAAEAAQLTPAEASNLLAVIDSMTSPEAYDVLRAAHGRSDRQIARSWTRSIEAILAGWPGVQPDTGNDIDIDIDKENDA
jgi:TetR/AcrR family transcriptional regulator of autoinduction and epiphytic fitness